MLRPPAAVQTLWSLRVLALALLVAPLLLSRGAVAVASAEAQPEDRCAPRSFNDGWRFNVGENSGAETPGFDDRQWRSLDLPHDWSMDERAGADPAFGAHDRDTPEGASVGYLRGGVGWYRRHFVVAPEDAGKGVEVLFDGAQQEADVWINGRHVAFQPHGYIAFHQDLTPHLNPPGQDNVIVVRTVNPEANTRWYAGSGLYRDVSLRIHDLLHVPAWGARVDTAWLTAEKALLHVKLDVKNDRPTPEDVTVELSLTAPDGVKSVHALGVLRVGEGARETLSQQLEMTAPQLWSPAQPALYRAEFRLMQKGRVVDVCSQSFGIRTVAVSAEKGLLLNGKPIKLKGACLHHDNGLLGAAAFATAEDRRVRIMKQNGFNAIRTSHNPPSTAFLNACDRRGMLVIDEFADQWELPKKLNGYQRYFARHWAQDLDAMIARDFNHPSVIIWSIGNEIPERATAAGVEIGRKLASLVHQLDARRPVTNAICAFYDNPQFDGNWDVTAAAFRVLDIGGYNYLWKNYETDHAKHPARVMAGTESFPKEALENWRAVERHAYVIGDFVWTGMDHLGESGIGHNGYIGEGEDPLKATPTPWGLMPWPWWINWSGDIDITGNKKPQSYYRDVVWGESQVELAVHEPIPADKIENVGAWGWPAEFQSWNWAGQEGRKLQVNVYSRASRVRLELNGRVLAEQEIDPAVSITASFVVPYAPGTLKASALSGGRVIATRELVTTGAPAALKLAPETQGLTATRGTLVYIPIEVVDSDGRLVPDAAVSFDVAIAGPAELVALGTADPTELSSLRDSQTRSFRGRALAILRLAGEPGGVTVTARGAGLQQAVAVIEPPLARQPVSAK